jgi:hypothetical protein
MFDGERSPESVYANGVGEHVEPSKWAFNAVSKTAAHKVWRANAKFLGALVAGIFLYLPA